MATHKIRIATGMALAVGATWLAPTLAASSGTWDRLAQCESGQRWDANTGNGYYGGLQFSAGTWLAYGGAAFADKAHRATRAEQITIAERLLADRGWGPWPSCSTKLRLTAADAAGVPFPTLPSSGSPTPPTSSAPPTADAAAVLAAAERKATNTAARAAKKLAELHAAQLLAERAIRNARTAPPEQQPVRAAKIARLQAKAAAAAAVAADARADADRAARKLRAARAAAGVTP
jgi:hypothetical protein